MKKLLLAVALIFIMPILAFAGNDYGIVDVQKALSSLDSFVKERKEIQEFAEKAQGEIKKIGGNIQKLQEDFIKKAKVLSESAKKQKETEIKKKMSEYEKTAREHDEKLKSMERKFSEKYNTKIFEALKQVLKEKNLKIILEKDKVAYFEDSLDITDEVIKKLKESKEESAVKLKVPDFKMDGKKK